MVKNVLFMAGEQQLDMAESIGESIFQILRGIISVRKVNRKAPLGIWALDWPIISFSYRLSVQQVDVKKADCCTKWHGGWDKAKMSNICAGVFGFALCPVILKDLLIQCWKSCQCWEK